LKADYYKSARETTAEFNARMDAEDIEAATVKCPLESCGAEIGESCCTDSGIRRIRHARRLWQARKES
jgi:predicted oxidoreductase